MSANNPKIIILGCGASASIVSHVFPNAIIVGKVAPPLYNFGLHYLHRPLDAFNYVKVKIDTVIDYMKANEENIKAYKKSIYGDNWEAHVNKKSQFPVGEHYGWLIKGNRKPLEVARNGLVTKVNLKEKLFMIGEDKFYYDFLINTIPLNTFLKLCDIETKEDFKCAPICIHQRTSISNYTEETHLRVDYFSNYEFYRSTILYEGNKSYGTMEHIGDCLDGVATLRPGKTINSGAIQYELSSLYIKNVICIGRYAQWDSSILLHDVYDRTKILKDIIYGL